MSAFASIFSLEVKISLGYISRERSLPSSLCNTFSLEAEQSDLALSCVEVLSWGFSVPPKSAVFLVSAPESAQGPGVHPKFESRSFRLSP